MVKYTIIHRNATTRSIWTEIYLYRIHIFCKKKKSNINFSMFLPLLEQTSLWWLKVPKMVDKKKSSKNIVSKSIHCFLAMIKVMCVPLNMKCNYHLLSGLISVKRMCISSEKYIFKILSNNMHLYVKRGIIWFKVAQYKSN